MMKRQIIIISGPTGSGKSDLAIKLAKHFNGFLISADSRQVYKGMDIGTNKDKGEWRLNTYFVQGIEEHLINIVNPDEPFSLSDWIKKAKEEIEARPDKLPIIVGGTGLYASALINNYKLPKSNLKLRKKLETELAKKGVGYLLQKLKIVDPMIENKIDIKNPRRVIRALEICWQTKMPFVQEKGEAEFEILNIGIKTNKKDLYFNLDRRTEGQFKHGLIEETKTLIKNGYSCQLPSMSGIGYKNVCQYLNNKISLEQAIALNKRDNRRYAKRQMTWLKKGKDIIWIKDVAEAVEVVKNFLR